MPNFQDRVGSSQWPYAKLPYLSTVQTQETSTRKKRSLKTFELSNSPLDSEDDHRSDSRNISHQQQSF